MKFDLLNISLDSSGRAILNDEQLGRLEAHPGSVLAGRGWNSGDCTGTTNDICLNSNQCGLTSNGGCMNQGVCPKYQEQ